ncbi:hypothetical protein BHE74_00009188 [Ensete ventricosum]|nr:hypothetical protein BHE74_00009188 [Ensete ventricosum]
MEWKLRSAALTVAVVLAVAACTMEMGAVAAQSLCKMSQEGVEACKPCISTVKPAEQPSDACCAALKQADLPCLCYYKNSNLLPYLGIDPKRAMQLPAKCSMVLPQQC